MNTRTSQLTAERLREVVGYDESTGVFTWKERRGRAKPGKVAGCKRDDGYIVIRIDGVSHTAHRLAWLYVHGEWPREDTDHINGVRDDNRIANLRDVPRRVNLQNMRKAPQGSASGVLGAAKAKNGRVRAVIRNEAGTQQHLGTFDSIDQAHSAYVDAKRRLHVGCTL